MDYPGTSDLDTEINNDLQNELLDLVDLYPDSEEEDILQDENDLDDDGLFENDYETIEDGSQPDVSSQDPLLKALNVKYGDSIFYNTDEENEVILNCADSDLQALLIKNRVRAKQLRVLRNKLVKVLQDCVERAQCTKTKPSDAYITFPKLDTWKLGIPYFKDNKFYRCEKNSDEIRKNSNKELCMFDFRVGRRWTANEHVTLQVKVQSCYYNHWLDSLQQRISALKFKMRKLNKADGVKSELVKLQEKLKELKENPAQSRTPPLNCDVGVYWERIVHCFKGHRTANECKAMWNVYLHPQINKSLWTQEENEKIQTLAKKYNKQNWDLIASELDTNRSGYLVFLHYFSNLWNKFKIERFQPTEDEHLIEVVNRCRIGNFIPWRKVSLFFQDRSKQQLYHRYKYYLSQNNTIKGTFTEEEDILIVYLVKKFGKNYSKCAEYMPTRTNVQIRNRYTGYLDKVLFSLGKYTEAEDQKILEHVELHGTKRWKPLAVELKRGRSHVRQRYLTLMKWMGKSDHGIKHVRSRKLSLVSKQNEERRCRMEEILEKLKGYKGPVDLDVVKRLVEQRKKEANTRRKPWHVVKKHTQSYIDCQLLDFFKGTCKIQREYKAYEEESIENSANRVGKLLELLAGPSDLSCLKINAGNFTEREKEVVEALKNSVERKPATFLSLCPQIRFFLPPTLNTILGLRGLIVKYQVYKNSAIAMDFDDAPQHDSQQQRMFFQRFYASFKWASVVSKFFPEQLEKTPPETVNNEDEKQKRSRGRPPKVENPKIALMLNARKRKRLDSDCTIVPVSSAGAQTDLKKKEGVHPLSYLKSKTKGVAKTSEDVAVYTITLESLENLNNSEVLSFQIRNGNLVRDECSSVTSSNENNGIL